MKDMNQGWNQIKAGIESIFGDDEMNGASADLLGAKSVQFKLFHGLCKHIALLIREHGARRSRIDNCQDPGGNISSIAALLEKHAPIFSEVE